MVTRLEKPRFAKIGLLIAIEKWASEFNSGLARGPPAKGTWPRKGAPVEKDCVSVFVSSVKLIYAGPGYYLDG